MPTSLRTLMSLIAVLLLSVPSYADSFTNKIKSYGEDLFACQNDDQCVWVKKECCSGGAMVISQDYEKRWASFWQAQCRGFRCESDTIIPAGTFARCVDSQCQIVRAPTVSSSTVSPSEEPVYQKPAELLVIEEPLPELPVVHDVVEPPAPMPLKPQKKVQAKRATFDLNTNCSDLKRRADQEKCLVQKIDHGLISAEVCEGLKAVSSRHTEKCYLDMAHQTGDLLFCNEIEDSDQRFACYHQETKGRVK